MAKYPSCTTILKWAGMYDDMDAAPVASQEVGKHRGSAVHKACQYLALGQEPPWKSPHPELNRYTDPMRDFLRQHEVRVQEIEPEWVNDDERVLAHPDIVAILDGCLTVIEIKTGALPSWVGLQTSGQLIARRWGQAQCRRMALSLPGDSSYKLKPLTDWRDASEFRCLLQSYHIAAK